jgi:hypothetical protein
VHLTLTSFLFFFLPFFICFLVGSFLPTHCRCRGYCCTWSHIMTSTRSVGLLWTRDRPVAETCTWQHTRFTGDRHPCPRRDSNPQSQLASGRRRALDRAATGIGPLSFYMQEIWRLRPLDIDVLSLWLSCVKILDKYVNARGKRNAHNEFIFW